MAVKGFFRKGDKVCLRLIPYPGYDATYGLSERQWRMAQGLVFEVDEEASSTDYEDPTVGVCGPHHSWVLREKHLEYAEPRLHVEFVEES